MNRERQEADTRLTFRLPQALHDKAMAKAKREDVTLSQILRRCLREWVESDPPEEEEQQTN